MKLFISWSGATSQAIASELRAWFPLILPSVDPFITTSDIEKGAQWQGTIKAELGTSNYGLVVLTPNNLQSQWIAFEAGALSKHLDSRVATLLFNVGHSEVKPPLGLFQGTLFTEEDFRKLISDINKAVAQENRRGEDQLDTLFPMLWPKLKEPIDLILQNANQANPPAQEESTKDIAIQEALALLRQQNAILSSPEKFLAPIINLLASDKRWSDPPNLLGKWLQQKAPRPERAEEFEAIVNRLLGDATRPSNEPPEKTDG